MRKLLTILIALAVTVGVPASSFAGSMSLLGVGGGSAATYQGPGDVYGAAKIWGGLRAFSAAYAASLGPCVDLSDQAGGNITTFNVTAAGDLDVASISTWVTAHSVTTIHVVQLYDQSGNAHHFSNGGGLSTWPTLVLSGLGSRPIITFTTAQALASQGSLTQAQPMTMSAVAERTPASSGAQVFFAGTSSNPGFWFHGTNTATIAAGSSADVTATDMVWHAFQGVFQDSVSAGTSTLLVDTTSNTGLTIGTNGFSASVLGINNGSFPYAGNFLEGGVWAGAASGANQTAANSQQKTYWGF